MGVLSWFRRRSSPLVGGPYTASAVLHASGTGTGSLAFTNEPTALYGFSIRETTGSAAAVVEILNGETGAMVASVSLLAGESVRDWFGPIGIGASAGLYLSRVSGTTKVSVYANV